MAPRGGRVVRIFAPLSRFKDARAFEKNIGIPSAGCFNGYQAEKPKAGLFAAAAVLTLLAAPAYSQSDSDSKVVVDPDSLPQAKALDRRYREILDRQPDGKDPHDPWGSVRASEAPKAKDQKKNPASAIT